MSRIESIQTLIIAISDTLTKSRESFKQLPAPLANQLMPQVERDDGKIEIKLSKMDQWANKTVAGDTVSNGSQLARETKNVLPLLADRTKATENVGKVLMKIGKEVSPLDQIKINRVVRDTTQINQKSKTQTDQLKKDGDALAGETSSCAQKIPNGMRVMNINKNEKTCELVFAGTCGVKVKLKLTHVLNSGGHCSLKNLDKQQVLGTLSCTYTATDKDDKDVEKNDSGSKIEFVLPGDGKEVKVTYNCMDSQNRVWCGEKRVDITVDGKKKAPCTIKVCYPGLKMLDVSGTCLVAYQGPGEQSYHPSNVSHYGKPELIRKLREVAAKFTKLYQKTATRKASYNKKYRSKYGFIKSYANSQLYTKQSHQFESPYLDFPGASVAFTPGENPVFETLFESLGYKRKKLSEEERSIKYYVTRDFSPLKKQPDDEQTFKEFKHNIYVNDMSLIWGGAFKTGNNTSGGHSEHDTGEDVDISFNWLSFNCSGKELIKQRLRLESMLDDVFGVNKVWYHGERSNIHWHCTINSDKNFKKTKYREKKGVAKEKIESY